MARSVLKKHGGLSPRGMRRNNRNNSHWINERTGQPYSGPVHYHDGRAMVGARHSSQPHDYLRPAGTSGNMSGQISIREAQAIIADANGYGLMSFKDCMECSSSAGDALSGNGNLNMGACAKCRDYMSTL